jgi:hypothetical protein
MNRIPSGASKMISEPMVCLTQTEVSLDPRRLGVPFGASKMIFEHLVHLAQTVHLSRTDSNTVSKEKEVRFHMTHVT